MSRRSYRYCRGAVWTAGFIFLSWTAAIGTQKEGLPSLNPHEIAAVRAAKPPVIDGEIGEEEWKGATVVTGFMQYEPRRGERSDVQTEALVLYDAGHVYVAFRARDPEPITAQLTFRDSDLFTDDAVAVVLDTTADRRSGYYFITNALGTQADGRIADDGRILESSWDAPWQSAARRTDYGWSAEFSLPLSSIKYAAGKSQTWGINFGRSRRRTLERSFWTGPLDSQWRVSQAGRIVELDVPPPLDRIQVVPYGLTRVQEKTAPHWEGGIDARYALTPTTAVRNAAPRFRHHRGRSGADQSDALRADASGETSVLPGRAGTVQPAVPYVLLPADRGDHGRQQAARQTGPLDHGFALSGV